MKKCLLVIACLSSFQLFASDQVCEVRVCNKIERVSLNIWSHVKDDLGKTCFNVVLPADQAKEGHILSAESRWYQGSFNPTKESVTKVVEVLSCSETES